MLRVGLIASFLGILLERFLESFVNWCWKTADPATMNIPVHGCSKYVENTLLHILRAQKGDYNCTWFKNAFY